MLDYRLQLVRAIFESSLNTPLRQLAVRYYYNAIRNVTSHNGTRGDVVGRENALRTGRLRVRFPMVSLEFFNDIYIYICSFIDIPTLFLFFIDTMVLVSTQPLIEMSTRNIFWGIKATGA